VAKDERLYAKFTLDFPDSPKIMPLPVEAKWALVDMTIYSRRLMTDGFISKPLALAKWGLDVCLALSSNDPDRPSLIEVENGYQIHDFAEHQSTRAEIEALSAKRRAAGQKGGQASAKAKGKQTRGKSNPETETQTDNSLPTDVGREARTRRGTRLPDNWRPSDDTIAEMRRQCQSVDLKTEHAKFTDYFLSAPGQKGVKRDWDAAWRNWIRRAAENQPRAPAATGTSGQDAKVLDYMSYANPRPELEQ